MNGLFGDSQGDLFQGLLTLIKAWKPNHCNNEKEYQKSLYDYLTSLQDKGQIREGRKILRERGANNIDIQVDGVGIEVGMNLKHQPEVDRKTAQVKRMLKEFDYLIIVFVGNGNSRQHITLLRDAIKDFEESGDFTGGGEKVVRVIEVNDRSGNSTTEGEDGDDGDDSDDKNGFYGGLKMPEIKMPKIEMPDLRF